MTTNNKRIRLIQLTDSHLSGNDNITNQQSLEAVVKLIEQRETRANCLIATGDLSQDGSAQSYRNFKHALAPLSLPIHVLAGNHDAPAEMAKHFNEVDHVQYGDWVIIFVSSFVENCAHGDISTAALVRLQTLLTEHQSSFVIIAIHHPPVTLNSQWMDNIGLKNPGALFERLKPFQNVRAIFSGHVHQEIAIKQNGILLLTTPSTCRQFLPQSDDFALDTLTAGYRWIDCLANGMIETGVTRLNSKV